MTRQTSPAVLSGQAVGTFALACIFALVLVTLTPFRVYNAYAVAIETSGDTARQLALVFCLSLSALAASATRFFRVTSLAPASLLVVFAWIALSLLWSDVPDIALRRAASVSILTLATLLCVAAIDAQRAIRVLTALTLVVLLVDLVSVFTVPTAVHLLSERNLDLVGAWRGIHTHKNNAATAAVLGALLSTHSLLQRRTRVAMAGFLLSIVFLIGTRSVTSITVGAGALSLMLLSFRLYRSRTRVPFSPAFFAIIASLIITALIAFWPAIAEIFGDPTSFTGRVVIWQILVSYSFENLLTGSGFGSFWAIGYMSPALAYNRDWAGLSAPHGHNGYLDILATLGLPGLILGLWAFVLTPLLSVRSATHLPNETRAFCLAWFAFAIGNNLLETSWLSASNVVWTVWLVCLAITRLPQAPPVTGLKASSNQRTQDAAAA